MESVFSAKELDDLISRAVPKVWQEKGFKYIFTLEDFQCEYLSRLYEAVQELKKSDQVIRDKQKFACTVALRQIHRAMQRTKKHLANTKRMELKVAEAGETKGVANMSELDILADKEILTLNRLANAERWKYLKRALRYVSWQNAAYPIVIRGIIRGKTCREIGDEIGVSPAMAHIHLLDIRSRVEILMKEHNCG